MPPIKEETLNTPTLAPATPQPLIGAIDATTLNTPQTPLGLQTPTPQTTFPVATLDTEVPDLTLTKPEEQATDVSTRLQALNQQLLGQSAFTAEQEQAQGIPELQATQTDLSSRLKAIQNEALAIPLQLQQEAKGRGITTGGLRPLETGRLRENAIQALGVSSLLEASRGNMSTALNMVDRAVAQKFDPIKERIAVTRANLDLILESPEYSLADKNRARRQQEVQDQVERETLNKEIEDKEIYNMALTAQKFGADTATTQAILNSKTKEEALIAGGTALQDPQAKLELQNVKLDNTLKKLKISSEIDQAAILKQYGGLTPKEWAAERKKEDEMIAKQKADASQAVLDGISIEKDISQINAVISSKALDTVVGPTFLTRGILRQKKGFLGKTASLAKNVATLGLTSGVVDEFLGADDTVASIVQITDKLFLDKLINVKSQGATFGALSDNEGRALRTAATLIGNSAIREGGDPEGRIIGFDMTEKAFKQEMEKIRSLSEKAYKKATGKAYTPDEQAVLDAFISEVDLDFNPEF